MQKLSLFSSSFFLRSAVLTLALLVAPATALAGFQWVAPTEDYTTQAPPRSSAQSLAPTLTPAPMSPVIIQGSPSLQPSPPPADTTMAASRTAPYDSVPDASHVLAPPSGAGADLAGRERAVRGFADNVPLAVALRQILPPEIGFSVGQDINLGMLVSWKGSGTWRETLQAMLQSSALAMQEQGQMIKITRAQGAATVEKQSAAMPTLQPPAESKPMSLLAAPTPETSMTLQPPAGAALPYTPPSPQYYGGAPSQTSVVDTWTANRGDTLRKVLEDWSRRANVELSWQAEYDYPLQASVTLTGTFEEAVRNLLVGFQEAQPQPTASLYNNPSAGQAILVVQSRGNNHSE